VFVLKFAAPPVVGKVITYLERHVRTGLLAVNSSDPTGWKPIEPTNVRLPKDRAARILLLVHGTFSSTVGAFGGFGATDWGRSFLDAAFGSYDVVLGFDHRILSVDPLENASELIAPVVTVAPLEPYALSRRSRKRRSVHGDPALLRLVCLECARA
jgi:hypothetical protein